MLLASEAAVLFDYIQMKRQHFHAEVANLGHSRMMPDLIMINSQLPRITVGIGMDFTLEEKKFITRLTQLEEMTSKSVPVPAQIMGSVVNATRTGTIIPQHVAIKGYSVCMERIIRYVSQLDFFTRYYYYHQLA